MDKRLVYLLSLAQSGRVDNSFSASTLLNDQNLLVVYGHGSGFIPVKNAILDRLGLTPKFILDEKYRENLQNDSVFNAPCMALNEFLRLGYDVKKIDVLVSVGSEKAYLSIRKMMENSGIKNIYWAPDIYDFNVHHQSDGLDVDPKLIYHQAERIKKAFGLLADEESKDVFLTLLDIYVSHKPKRVPSNPVSEQYFPRDIFCHKSYRSYINCGAYTGDSVRSLISNFGKIEKLICIEPDAESFSRLVEFCSENKEKISNEILLIPVALGSRHEALSFKSNLGLCSEIANDGHGNFIQSTTLDNLCPKFQASFISMDLEGYEVQALQGSLGLLKASKPSLGISIYHHVQDLWEILLYIDSMGLGYKFYMRNYTGFSYETVLYCKQEEF